MIEVQARRSRQKLNEELVAMARCLTELGPNVNEIARRQNLHRETVRYRYHRFFLRQNLRVQAVPNYSRLGFKRFILVARLSLTYDRVAKRLFDVLSQTAYLHSYTRVLLTGNYVIHIATPVELAQRCKDLYRTLYARGIFSSLEILEFDEIRNPPMKTEQFDFVSGTWKSDCLSRLIPTVRSLAPLGHRPETYDRIDLLVLKEMDKDAATTLVKMARAVKVNLSSIEFHYRDHVKAKGLIRGYRLIWQGTNPNVFEGKPSSRNDTYIEFTLLLVGASRAEMEQLMMILNATPFLWSEAVGSAYCSELFVPHTRVTELLEYLDEFANSVGEKLRVAIMDQGHARRYVIAYSLFDGVGRKWQLDESSVVEAVMALAG